jgi:hypothetical protein
MPTRLPMLVRMLAQPPMHVPIAMLMPTPLLTPTSKFLETHLWGWFFSR